MKKAFLIILLVLILLIVSGCNNGVRINQNSVYIDNVILSIRHGYKLAEDAYSIVETAEGYDIVIHAVREEAAP